MDKKVAVKIENLMVKYENLEALENINLTVYENDFLGIIGPNGAGKSTLIKCILGLVKQNSGSIEIFGENPNKTKINIGYVPQFSKMNLTFPITLEEAVTSGYYKNIFTKYTKEMKEYCHKILNDFNLYDKRNSLVSELSGGQRQRMLIARAIISNPKLLILDEPTASADYVASENIFDILSNLENLTKIVVTHDMLAVSQKIQTVACLNKTLVYHGSSTNMGDIGYKLYGTKVDFLSHGVNIRVLDSKCSCCEEKL